MGASMFKGIGGAKPRSKQGSYLGKGQYVTRIDNCKTGTSRENGDFACVEMTVLVALQEGGEHKVGDEVTVMFMERKVDYFLPEVLEFISIAAGVDIDGASDEEKEEAANLVFGGENPLGGTIVEVHGLGRISKEGNPYVVTQFKQEITPADAIEVLDEATQERFFPNGALAKMAAA